MTGSRAESLGPPIGGALDHRELARRRHHPSDLDVRPRQQSFVLLPCADPASQEILKDWLIAQGTVDATVTPIWSFVPIGHPVEVVFESSPEARHLVAAGGRIRHVGEGQSGFALYSVSLC